MAENQSRLTGAEAEKWFKQFAETAGILSRKEYSLEKVVNLLNSQVQLRLGRARLYMERAFPDGNQWIDQIISKKKVDSIPAETRKLFTAYLLDRVAATDSLIEMRTNQGRVQRIAVDVTVNPDEEQAKLDRIRGKPDKEDRPGSNRNLNLPNVRRELAIDKHIVVLLNSDRQMLPSYDYLLSEIFALTNSRARTQSLNLMEVPEANRFQWNQPEASTPKELWNKFSKGASGKNEFEIAVQASMRALNIGHSEKAVVDMLRFSRQYLQLYRSSLEKAEKFTDLVYTQALEKVQEKGKQRSSDTSKQSLTPSDQQNSLNESALKSCWWLSETFGEVKPDGSKVWEAGGYIFYGLF